MSQHYESTSPNSSTTSTSSMSSEISEGKSVLGSEDIDAREDSDHVLDYGEFVEPIATQEEFELYAENVARQQEEEETLLSRFSRDENVDNW